MSDTLLDRAMGRAAPLADVVIREGQILFPYRASALKNRYRWQWGVLAPPAWVAASGSDRSAAVVECVADVRSGAAVSARVRFLHLETRSTGASPSTPDEWDEALECHVDIGPLAVPDGDATVTADLPIDAAASTKSQPAGESSGEAVVRRRRRVEGRVILHLERIAGPWSLIRIRLTVENTTECRDRDADRADALRSSLVAVHAVLAVERGAFVSSTDPPEFAAASVAACRSSGLWPSLAGPVAGGDVMLAAPIILPDHAAVAAASPGETCDATEIDRLLSLSVAALGEGELLEARRTDPVAAAIVERLSDAAGSDTLHAAAPVPEPVAMVGGLALGRGTRVVLRPAAGGDAQDVFIAGRIGIVETVLHDVDGTTHVAVTIEGDPGADLHRLQGRYRYFRLHELEAPGER